MGQMRQPRTSRRPPGAPTLGRTTARIFYYRPLKKWALDSGRLPAKEEREAFYFFLKADCNGEFSPEAKVWLIPENKYDELVKLVRLNYSEVLLEERPPDRPPPILNKRAGEPAILVFARLTGSRPSTLEEAKKLYRIAAVRLHPDRGGDGDQMAQLNVAWAEVQSELTRA
jgi:hypothetical protein